ncbi:MAG: branched-chain amino acid ABC transporter permease, partial [Oscillospiraceae bacterium]|nr:branched-chain amino acid ABC transporter permease [Oscillospiraceae bacterium]
ISAALGIVLYGMFLAIIVPPSRKQKSVLCVVLTAAILSILCKYLLPALSGGFAVILCAVTASVIGALLFPREEETS